MLEVKNLCYSCKNNTKILNNIDFSVQNGEILGIIGKTGSGKSTLARLLNTLLRPTSGQIFLDKLNIHEKSENQREIFFKIGLIFQCPEQQFFENTVYDEIAYGLRNKKIGEQELREKIYNLYKKIYINKELLLKSPAELSGGEKRLCAISGVLVMQPEVLILDEPFIGLDSKNRERIINILLKYHKETQRKIIIISSFTEDIFAISNKILILEDGNQKYFGDINKNILKYNIILPEVTKIMSIINQKYSGINNNVFNIQDALLNIKEFLDKRRLK